MRGGMRGDVERGNERGMRGGMRGGTRGSAEGEREGSDRGSGRGSGKGKERGKERAKEGRRGQVTSGEPQWEPGRGPIGAQPLPPPQPLLSRHPAVCRVCPWVLLRSICLLLRACHALRLSLERWRVLEAGGAEEAEGRREGTGEGTGGREGRRRAKVSVGGRR